MRSRVSRRCDRRLIDGLALMDDDGCRHGPIGCARSPQRVARGSALPTRRQVEANPARSELLLHRQLELEPGSPRPTLNEPLLTPHEAAALLAVRVSWIYDAVRGERLRSCRQARPLPALRPRALDRRPAPLAHPAGTPRSPRPAEPAPRPSLNARCANAAPLSFFLAEVAASGSDGGIIVDDPVSSLDDERRSYIARRLVAEAANRQVVVLTHDLPFMLDLIDQAEEAGLEPSVQGSCGWGPPSGGLMTTRHSRR